VCVLSRPNRLGARIEHVESALTSAYRYYIILAVFNACNAVVLWFFYPETKKLSLEELDFFFANKYGYDVPMKEVALENAKKNDIERVETVGHVSD
jgi:hypothetical protein